jgi:hypothetical protein
MLDRLCGLMRAIMDGGLPVSDDVGDIEELAWMGGACMWKGWVGEVSKGEERRRG